MSLKELIGISLATLVLFPLILLGALLGTGTVHLEVGNPRERENLKEVFKVSEAAKQDSSEAAQLKLFKALQNKERELEERESRIRRETDRLETLKSETAKAKTEIAEHRRRIEELVAKNGDLQDKQITGLAEVYGSMRPDEAAPILLSLKDPLVVKILKKIPDARAASKLMAALGALDLQRAARITELMGKSALPGVAKPAVPAEKAPAKPDSPAAPAKSAARKEA